MEVLKHFASSFLHCRNSVPFSLPLRGKKENEKDAIKLIFRCLFNGMSEPGKRPSPGVIVALTVIGVLIFISVSGGIREPWTSPANACINNLRVIDAAKNQWMLEHNAKTNVVVGLDDLRPYFMRDGGPNGYFKLGPKDNLPKRPLGGTYTIGKIGEPPTCSLGATVTPHHVLP